MKRTNLRIIHGFSEVAGQNYYAAKGLREIGEDAFTVVWQPSPFAYPYDVNLKIDKTKRWLALWYGMKLGVFLFYALCRYNVYHFHFGRSILFNRELWLYDLLGKRYVYEFHGSDLRDHRLFYELNPELIPESQQASRPRSEKQEQDLRRILRKARTVILHDDELIPHLPEFHGELQVVPLRIDPTLFVPVYPSEQPDIIRIVHAPSKRAGKGTKFAIRAVEALKQKYPNLEFVLVEGKPQREAMEIYATADIIVDQLYTGTYGVFALESMALGKPVITRISEAMSEELPEELPVLSASPHTIEQALEELICDGAKRRAMGCAGRRYVEEYHDYKNIARVLSAIYRNELPPAHGREAFARVKAIHDGKDCQ